MSDLDYGLKLLEKIVRVTDHLEKAEQSNNPVPHLMRAGGIAFDAEKEAEEAIQRLGALVKPSSISEQPSPKKRPLPKDPRCP